jgi:hypothetical protein
METVKLYSWGYTHVKTYLFAVLFIAGNLILPQVCHALPIADGGLMLLPIYFFTLIAAYKYGIRVGLLTAVLSPLLNNLFFGMPPTALLPAILVKSVFLAVAAALVARRSGQISILALIVVVLAYQVFGTLVEWAIVKDFYVAVQDFRIGIPGMLLQVFGGYLLLKAIAKL